MTRRLTLSLGLRYEFETPPTEEIRPAFAAAPRDGPRRRPHTVVENWRPALRRILQNPPVVPAHLTGARDRTRRRGPRELSRV